MESSRDERNMAALAQCLGILAALPAWLWWRNRSAFVRAHAAQSMMFDGLTFAALVIAAGWVIGVTLLGNAALAALPGSGKDVALLLLVAVCVPGLALLGFLPVLGAALILRLRATVAANQGRLFCYPLLKAGLRTPKV